MRDSEKRICEMLLDDYGWVSEDRFTTREGIEVVSYKVKTENADYLIVKNNGEFVYITKG